jgi:hypothetical protein
MCSSILTLIFIISLNTQVAVQADSLLTKPADSTSVGINKSKDTINISDSAMSKYSVTESDSLIQNKINDSNIIKSEHNDTIVDSLFLNSNYLGFGIGWSLGSFEPAEMWGNTLPSELADLRLTKSTLIAAADSMSSDSLLRAGDSSEITFSIKDKPSVYNMAFPISILFVKFDKNYRHSLMVSFSIFSKKQKSTVSLLNDSLSRRIDIKQNFTLYNASLHYMIGKRIPPVYISVDGVDRTDVIAGIGVSPLIYMNISNSINAYSDDVRITGITDSIKSQIHNLKCNGLSLSFKAGLSTVKHLKKGALDASILYTITWNDYFYDNGTRVKNGNVDLKNSEATENLSFLSNKLEISIVLLKKIKHK